MNKKAMELAINFIVMLILAIVVFGFGLYFVQNVFNAAKDVQAQLDKDSEKNINAMLDRGEKVAFPVTSKDIKSDQVAIFGLGVLNVLTGDPVKGQTNFKVDISCTLYVTKGGTEIQSPYSAANCGEGWTSALPCMCGGSWTVTPLRFTLTKNERKTIPIAIQVPRGKPSGTYAFMVKVTDTSTPAKVYGDAPKQIYVNIN